MIQIRPARLEDAEFIARGFLTAMWVDRDEQARILPMCTAVAEMDDTLYSWRNAVIAQWDGQDAGVLISYNGAGYEAVARKTFAYVRDHGGGDFTQMNAEAGPGEWYLDTLAVLPAFRRKGIATALLRHGIQQGMNAEDVRHVTLYVDPEHPWAVKLYKSVGFESGETTIIFDQPFLKMAVEKL